MVDVLIRIEGIDPLLARLRQSDAIIREELTKAMHEATLAIEADAKGRVPQDTRMLMRSIVSEVRPIGGGGVRGVVGVLRGPATGYARVVEEGRGANKRPPPSAPIAAWLRRKGGDPSRAYVVARAIGRRGIRPRPYLIPAFQAQRGKVESIFRAAIGRIVKRLGA